MPTTTVLLVDDHALFREGLTALLATEADIEVVGQAATGQEAIAKARELVPDLVLMDIKMPGMSGLEATRRIKEELPHTRIVMLTVSEEEEDLLEAVKSGAEGYLLKTMKSAELFDMLQGVFRGEAPISRSMARRLWQELASAQGGPRGTQAAAPGPAPELTRRELEILRLLSEGRPDKEIAAHLGISARTVKNHVHNILEKLHLHNRVQAASYALKQGLVEPPRG